MQPADAFHQGFTTSFWTFTDIIFRWVPSTMTSLIDATQSAKIPTEPVSAWSVPELLSGSTGGPAYDSFVHAWTSLAVFSFTASIPFLGVVVYTVTRTVQIRAAERKLVEKAQQHAHHEEVAPSKRRWDRIMEQIGSDKPDQWRLAVLEADIMLNEVLDTRGYKGETMADKMKQVDRADLNSIDAAWEAHKFRNRIAHETSGNALEYREARRIISLYERVFREASYL